MAKVRVTMSSAGVRDLLRSAEVRAMVRPYAERVAARARETAPVETGNYRDGIGVESATTDRAVERVVAKAPHSHLVEARTGNLARALGSVGGD